MTSATTLSSLRQHLLKAFKSTFSPESQPTTLPQSEKDIALWRGEGGEETEWIRLVDEVAGADKWGLKDGAEIGVSIKLNG